jgi:membrane-associated phospholipid phosphatase
MAELAVVDRALVQALNHAAQPQPLRLLILLAATALAAVPALLLAGLAIQALRHRDPASLTVVVLAGLGGAAALGLNQLAGHLYFRPRPYWALPLVHAIGGRAGDSSFFSDHTTIAAAAAAGCLLMSRRWGLVAVAAALLVALGRVAIGAHYPSDVAVALLVGAGAVAALVPLRSPTQPLAGRLLGVDQTPTSPRPAELRLGVIALVLLAVLGGWLTARVQTTACGSPSTGPTAASAASCPPTPACTDPPASTPSPPAAGAPPARGSTATSPLSTANSTATSTSSSKPPTAASSCWKHAQRLAARPSAASPLHR